MTIKYNVHPNYTVYQAQQLKENLREFKSQFDNQKQIDMELEMLAGMVFTSISKIRRDEKTFIKLLSAETSMNRNEPDIWVEAFVVDSMTFPTYCSHIGFYVQDAYGICGDDYECEKFFSTSITRH